MVDNMGVIIRRLRKERDITQEELAEQIGVTSQAVSKWENNTGLPNISQIVPLANFFGVSTDTLFDFCSEDKTRYINDYKNRSHQLRNEGMNEENLILWREALKKNPGNFTCMLNLSYALSACASRESNNDAREKYIKEEIALCERILSGCTESDLRYSAIQMLVYAYGDPALSFADEEKAVSYAKMGCHLFACTNVLLEGAYFTDEGIKKAACLIDDNILAYMDMLTTRLAWKKNGNAEEQILFCRASVTLWKTLIPDDNFLFYHCRIYSLYAKIAYLSAQLGRREDTIGALQKAKYHAIQYDTTPKGRIYYTSPFVSHAWSDSATVTKNYSESEHELFLHELKDSCYDFLRDDPDFFALSQ